MAISNGQTIYMKLEQKTYNSEAVCIRPDDELIRTDIAAYLKKHDQKDLLRFLTCGSVDDGKSTLIGRLLYDTHMVYEDQLAAVLKDSKVHGTTGGGFDPALLTDGLKAEREQGITIDVAYRYFSTDKRTFIIADCPGHEQYTRNMATGASTCNLAIILIDARQGVLTQTRRHSFICSLLGIRHVLVAVNKMDLVCWSEKVYEQICKEYNSTCAARLGFSDIHFVPISALHGDNVANKSVNMPWYEGSTMLHHLESINIVTDRNLIDMRFPVQYVIRPNLDFRGFAGTVVSGVVRCGDEVISLPGRKTSRIKSIVTSDGEISEAVAPASVVLTLNSEIDVSRGSVLAPIRNQPRVDDEFEAMIVWMSEVPSEIDRSYLVKHATTSVPGQISKVRYKVDVNTMRKAEAVSGSSDGLRLNDIGRCHLMLHRPIAFDPYERNRATGAFILIDRVSNLTVGAGMIMDRVTQEKRAPSQSRNISRMGSLVSRGEREAILRQRGCTIWLTGLSGAGKSTIAQQLEKDLIEAGHVCYILDGDNMRHGLNKDLGFSAEDRSENIRRIAEVASLLNDAGIICIVALISPYIRDRARAREIINQSRDGNKDRFIEVHISTSLEVCEHRDPKGLYKKARSGQIQDFTGISAPYEPPENAEVIIDALQMTPHESSAFLTDIIRKMGII